MDLTVSEDHYRALRSSLASCIHDAQVYTWINWIDRIKITPRMNRRCHNWAQLRLDEINKMEAA